MVNNRKDEGMYLLNGVSVDKEQTWLQWLLIEEMNNLKRDRGSEQFGEISWWLVAFCRIEI